MYIYLRSHVYNTSLGARFQIYSLDKDRLPVVRMLFCCSQCAHSRLLLYVKLKLLRTSY